MTEQFKLDFQPTERGFLRADFKDHYNAACSLQKSSLATEDCVWLGQNEGTHHHVTGDCMARMHLTQDMARKIGEALLHFADTGELPVPDKCIMLGCEKYVVDEGLFSRYCADHKP